MKKLIFILMIFFSCFVFSQKQFEYSERHFPVEFVLKSAPNDTIKTRIKSPYRGIIELSVVGEDLNMIDQNGHKTIVSPDSIKFLKIQEKKWKNQTYKPSLELIFKDRGLLEVIFEGKKIKWYKGLHMTLTGNGWEVVDYFYDTEYKTLDEGFDQSINRRFKKAFNKYPDLLKLVEKAQETNDYIEILKRYDQK